MAFEKNPARGSQVAVTRRINYGDLKEIASTALAVLKRSRAHRPGFRRPRAVQGSVVATIIIARIIVAAAIFLLENVQKSSLALEA